ncbi:YHYH domain-containing protein [Methylophaga pinxianii]|nr:YHYH domain-containing protein [Methylophaga pinxianii]
MTKLTVLFIVLITLGSSLSHAHSGRTDKNGCHKDTKAGPSHCH